MGQGGCRIAQGFHDLGYRRIVALNTAQQDLNTINLKDDNKFRGYDDDKKGCENQTNICII